MRPGLDNFVKDMDKAWIDKRRHEAIAEHFADDGVLHDMTSPGPVTGRAAIAEALRAFTNAFSSMCFRVPSSPMMMRRPPPNGR
ncbi:nuclear transport factor 2 family protein [Rhodococcus sp. NPDC056960]|uniref:nuclear transport factor 2 family protein n=1 Tax=Rhodococcus sp. NPDC056960 TaxID=3345982 RepID=UPI00363627E3